MKFNTLKKIAVLAIATTLSFGCGEGIDDNDNEYGNGPEISEGEHELRSQSKVRTTTTI